MYQLCPEIDTESGDDDVHVPDYFELLYSSDSHYDNIMTLSGVVSTVRPLLNDAYFDYRDINIILEKRVKLIRVHECFHGARAPSLRSHHVMGSAMHASGRPAGQRYYRLRNISMMHRYPDPAHTCTYHSFENSCGIL